MANLEDENLERITRIHELLVGIESKLDMDLLRASTASPSEVLELQKLKSDVQELNDQLQSYVSMHGDIIPSELIHLLGDLDWLLRGESSE